MPGDDTSRYADQRRRPSLSIEDESRSRLPIYRRKCMVTRSFKSTDTGEAGRHQFPKGSDLPWRKRPRRSIDLRDGWDVGIALFASAMAFALVAGGLNGLSGDPARVNTFLAVAMLIVGVLSIIFLALYLLRPHDHPGTRWFI